MAEIIAFPSRTDERQRALMRLSEAVSAHMTAVFSCKNVTNVLPHEMVREMYETMLADGFNYEPEVLNYMARDPDTLKRIETLFIAALKRNGTLPQNFG